MTLRQCWADVGTMDFGTTDIGTENFGTTDVGTDN